MREEKGEGSWFARWEEQLPSPEELMPLSQSLITPHLAIAFDIPATTSTNTNNSNTGPPTPSPSSNQDLNCTDGGDEPARTLKRPRLVWTPQLHKRFVDAVVHLGIKNAVPKTIMHLMGVDGLTRENVASHLQKYRLYMKRMQSGGGVGGNVGGRDQPSGAGGLSHISPADHQLFSSAHVPHHLLIGRPGPPKPEPFQPIGASAAVMQQHYQQQQQHYYQQRHMAQFESPPNGFVMQRMMGNGGQYLLGASVTQLGSAYSAVEMESANGRDSGERRVLTLFPTGDDD